MDPPNLNLTNVSSFPLCGGPRHDFPRLSIFFYICILRLHPFHYSTPLASASLEFGNMLLYDVDSPRVFEPVHQLHYLARQCDQLGASMVRHL